MKKPNIYAGKLNSQRINRYQNLAELYNIETSTVREIFCKGAEWGISLTNECNAK